ncbi:long-chain-fatty-acid--CoA ligase [Thermodesulfobacteriota bacterium]
MNFKDLFSKVGFMFPDHEALVCKDTKMTGRQLFERVNRVSNALLDLGLKKGDRVAVLMNNSSQAVECFFGIMCSGLVYLPLNARNSVEEHLYMLNDAEAGAIIMGDEFGELLTPALSEAPTVSHVICGTRNPPDSVQSYEALLIGASPDEPQADLLDDDVCRLNYTSGTTGKPKGVLLTHRNFVTAELNYILTGQIEEHDTVLLSGPVTHASGAHILPHVLQGARAIVLENFDPKVILEHIQKERITTLMVVPTMLAFILAQPDVEKYDLSSLKTIRYGASPIPLEVLKKAIKVFKQTGFIQGYGLTEGGAPLTALSKKDHILDGTEKNLKRLLSIGRELPTASVRIVDEEGNTLPLNDVGEIAVRSDMTMKGYWNNPEATATALRGGWLHTRDMGYRDEDGYIYLVDRKEDMIISGGFNIYPKEVEDIIYMHPAVFEATVFGIPDDLWGESVKAVVSLKEGMSATADEIIDHCKNHLASYKKPKSVDFIKEIPKNPTGKILRRQLREPYWGKGNRKVN